MSKHGDSTKIKPMVEKLHMLCEGGCTAKLPAQALEQLLSGMDWGKDPHVLVGLQTGDDAGVYVLNEELGLVLTTDFFPPFCDDPMLYGEVAAVNALSDIYAMGGTPLAALNINLYPTDGADLLPLRAILEGGLKAANRAGVPIVGGHTIANDTPVYGMAVIGKVSPQSLLTNASLKADLTLILTNPLGVGVALAANRLGLCPPETFEAAKSIMLQLNREAAEVIKAKRGVAATDVTGFSLLGHAYRMGRASQVEIHIDANAVPYIPGVDELLRCGCVPGATFKNGEYLAGRCDYPPTLPPYLKHLLLDPQTSGGLLFAVEAARVEETLGLLHAKGYEDARAIGYTIEGGRALVVE